MVVTLRSFNIHIKSIGGKQMDIKEIFARMGEGKLSAHSELGTRDEAKQTKTFASRFRKMKTATGIKGHALVMKDLVIPFNPFTMESDQVYSSRTPFRPILLVSQALAGIKSWAAEHPDIASKWEEYLGASSGAIDWSAPPTLQDYYLFKARDLIKPRIMSYSTVELNFGGANGFPEYRRKYTVDPNDLDESNNYLPGKNPVNQMGAVFFNSMLKPEADAAVAALEKQGATKETITQQRRTIYSKSPVGFVNQTNLIPFLYFPIGEAPKAVDPKRFSDVEQLIRWYSYNTKKWGGAISEAMKENMFDENMDFFDFTMRTPSSTDTKDNGQVYTDDDTMELYTAMTITNTDSRVGIWSGNTVVDGVTKSNSEIFAPVFAAVDAYFEHSQEESFKEDGESFEKLMAASNGFRPFSSVQDKFLAACNQVFLQRFAESPYFTEQVKKANATFFTMMNAENALALASVDDDEIAHAEAAQQESIGAIIAEAREAMTDDDGDTVGEIILSDD